MQWTKALKLALLEENDERLEALIEELPQLDSLEQMNEAAFMMQEVHNYLSAKKEDYASKLIKIKKQKAFLNANAVQSSSFDQSH